MATGAGADGQEEDAPTLARERQDPPSAEAAASDGGRFAPGTVLAGRYRIVALLGRGGMGQVYRADDLKLSQTVALKFLPDALARDGAALARFHREVRLARQIAHPNVCRVFDIGELGGEHFLTMEYIDGEDLASLVRRIGRLPHDKAVEIARQVCAGLAAAHDAGVLHRDLKPANVMIDGRGRARVTDFGLAGLEAELRVGGDASGTPAYMAPEQLAGREFTRRSEVYALGLLLYELFTGRRLFDAVTLPEILRQRGSGLRAAPSSVVRDLDPLVERLILRCLEEDPVRRPGSVLQAAAALPGGNALDAALAAGETPSPEMVAAARTAGALRSRTAGLALGGVLLLLFGLAAFDRSGLHHLLPLEKTPEVLADRAGSVLAGLGYRDRPADRAWGFGYDPRYLNWADPRPAPARWRRLATGRLPVYYYWYRQSPAPLEPNLPGVPSQTDPPARTEGMASVVLDPLGRLVELEVVPPARFAARAPTPFDWRPIFAAAGLDPGALRPASPEWTPPVVFDERAAWEGSLPDDPDVPLRVEAAAYAGRAVYFRVAGPWSPPPLAADDALEGATLAALAIVALLIGTVVVGGIVMARRNLRLGRGDRDGARKVAVAAFGLTVASTLLGTDATLTIGGVLLVLLRTASDALAVAALLWLLYVALEPYVRRNRPELIVSWTRLLAGEWRDPMVGRDVLAGCLLGLAAAASIALSGWLKSVFAVPYPPNHYLALDALGGTAGALGGILGRLAGATVQAFATLVFVALARRLLRTEARAAVFLWLVLFALQCLVFARSWPAVASAAILTLLWIVSLTRLGLLAGIAFGYSSVLAYTFPLTTDFSRSYAGTSALVLAVLTVLALVAWRISLGDGGAAPHADPAD